MLKAEGNEPDAAAAAEIGVSEIDDETSQVGNPVARDMLLRMPGVTPATVSKLMEAAGSLAGLADLPLARVQAAVGANNGKSLFDFLHAPYPVS